MKDWLKALVGVLIWGGLIALFCWEPEHVRLRRETEWKSHDETTRLELELHQAELRAKIRALCVEGGTP